MPGRPAPTGHRPDIPALDGIPLEGRTDLASNPDAAALVRLAAPAMDGVLLLSACSKNDESVRHRAATRAGTTPTTKS